MSGDNFHFDITGVGLSEALAIAFKGAPGGKAVGWAELPIDPKESSPSAVWGAAKGTRRLVLFWHPTASATGLPAPMDAAAAESFVKAWLENTDYGPEPDHDGDNGKGWRVYNEAWGHVAGDHYAFVAIEPVWLMYGK